jgi:hypothetical protein
MSKLAERLAKMPQERRHYTIITLAEHMDLANQFTRLRDLFNSQEWRHVRVPHDGYRYTGYLVYPLKIGCRPTSICSA